MSKTAADAALHTAADAYAATGGVNRKHYTLAQIDALKAARDAAMVVAADAADAEDAEDA